jgi:phospholipid/cholesterol/gamma-HCH transport system substrate-binding protein
MKGRSSDLILGVGTIAALIAVCALVFSGVARNLLAPGGRQLRAVFANTGILSDGSPVRVHGVDVGTVTGIALDHGARSSTVTMTISDSQAFPIYRDATATLTWRTILGANYAIDIDRGTPASGPLTSGEIPLAHTSGQVEVDQVLSSLQSAQRAGLRTMFDQFAITFRDAPALGSALSTLSANSPALKDGIGAVRGEQDGDLERLVSSTGRLMHALQQPSLRELVEGGAGTLTTTAARQADIQQTIALAEQTLPQVQLTATELDHTLGIANPVLARLRPVVGEVAPTATALDPTVTDANALLQQARPLLSDLRPASAALAQAARQARPLLDQLTPSVNEVGNEILPDLAKIYKGSGRATYEMIGPTLADLDAAAASLDGVSHFVTLTPGGGERSLDTLPCQTYFVDPTATQLIHCQSLSQALGGILGVLPSSGAHG